MYDYSSTKLATSLNHEMTIKPLNIYIGFVLLLSCIAISIVNSNLHIVINVLFFISVLFIINGALDALYRIRAYEVLQSASNIESAD